jgi:hypothetical protein
MAGEVAISKNRPTWRRAATAAAEHQAIQLLLAFALIVPLAATVGQFRASGFFTETAAIDLLFWPGARWHWAVRINAGVITMLFGASYLAGIAALGRRRALAKVIACGIAAMIVAQLCGRAVNHFTGWREVQTVGSMQIAGKANWLILALWHNPIWEELVFRGVPLLGYALIVKGRPHAEKAARWCYFLVPSLVFAAYHLPGHGYSRITDTFLLSLVFAWLALKYSFWSVVVLHYVFDALMVLSLGKLTNIPTAEVRWLADHFGVLNTAFSLAALAALAVLSVLTLRNRLARPAPQWVIA